MCEAVQEEMDWRISMQVAHGRGKKIITSYSSCSVRMRVRDEKGEKHVTGTCPRECWEKLNR